MKMYPLIKHHAMRMYQAVEVQLHAFLTLTLDWGECPASCLGHFNSIEREHSTYWI